MSDANFSAFDTAASLRVNASIKLYRIMRIYLDGLSESDRFRAFAVEYKVCANKDLFYAPSNEYLRTSAERCYRNDSMKRRYNCLRCQTPYTIHWDMSHSIPFERGSSSTNQWCLISNFLNRSIHKITQIYFKNSILITIFPFILLVLGQITENFSQFNEITINIDFELIFELSSSRVEACHR